LPRLPIRTIEEMEAYYYGFGATEIMKTDAPVLTTTTGVYQAIYGRKVWSQLNQEANIFGILPKKVWDQSGWRVITARAAASGGGVDENGTLPDTIKPTFAEVKTKPKSIAHNFDVSEALQFLGTVDDGLGDTMRLMREEIGKHHAEMMNVMLGVQNGALAGNDAESIDRVCGSYAELTACKENDQSTAYTAGDLDIYGLDRDAGASFADAVVKHNSSVNRELTLDLIDELFQDIWKAGGNPKVMLTGYDTLRKIQGLLQAQQRFTELKTIVPTYGGIQGVPGVAAGFTVATYNETPIIPSKNIIVDSGGLSRIYLLDTDYVFFKVAKPTQYFEAGIDKGDPFAVNRLGTEGMYRTMGELICTRFNVQGKIRDIA